jgi:hypothetical protein
MRGRRTRVLTALVLAACSSEDGPSERSEQTPSLVFDPPPSDLPAVTFDGNIDIPVSLSPSDLAVAANDGLTLALGTTVTRRGSAGAPVSNAGGRPTVLLSRATTGDVFSQSTVRLFAFAHVFGVVHAPFVRDDLFSTIDGGTAPAQAIKHVPVHAAFPAAPAVGDVVVPPGQTRTLVPGRYRNVTISLLGRLQITAGDYYFETLQSSVTGKLVADATLGPAHVFVRARMTLASVGTIADDGRADLLVAYFGTEDVHLFKSFQGVLFAPNALVDVTLGVDEVHGSLFGKTIAFLGNTRVVHEPANLFGPLITWRGDVEGCSNSIRPRPGQDNAALQAEIARYCTSPGVSRCMASLIGRSNAEYSASARQLQQNVVTPSQYIAVAQDRERKMRLARASTLQANQFCDGPDADRDWIPDGTDRCPGTPPLTATDDRGCPLAVLPRGPSREDVQRVFAAIHMAYNPRCSNAGVLPEVTAGAFFYPGFPERGSYILAGRIRNQTAECPIFYEFEINEFDLRTGAPGASYFVVFRDHEELAALIGGSSPVPSDFIQFNPRPGDPASRGLLATAGPRDARVRFRVRAMNGNGVHGAWSQWKLTDITDCHFLGFECQGR